MVAFLGFIAQHIATGKVRDLPALKALAFLSDRSATVLAGPQQGEYNCTASAHGCNRLLWQWCLASSDLMTVSVCCPGPHRQPVGPPVRPLPCNLCVRTPHATTALATPSIAYVKFVHSCSGSATYV